jgi:hypothetical protein
VLLVAEVKFSGKKDKINRMHYYSFASIAELYCDGRLLF